MIGSRNMVFSPRRGTRQSQLEHDIYGHIHLGGGDNYIREDGDFGLAFLDAMVRAPHCYRNPIAAAAIARELLSTIPDFGRDPSLRQHVQVFEAATYLIDNAASFLTSGEATEAEFDLLDGHLIIGLDGDWSRPDLDYFWDCMAQLDGQIIGAPVVCFTRGPGTGWKYASMSGIILRKKGSELSFAGPRFGKLHDTVLPAPRPAKARALLVSKYLTADDYTWYGDKDRKTWSEGTLGASLLMGAIEQRMTGHLWSFFEHHGELRMRYLPQILGVLLCRVHSKRSSS